MVLIWNSTGWINCTASGLPSFFAVDGNVAKEKEKPGHHRGALHNRMQQLKRDRCMQRIFLISDCRIWIPGLLFLDIREEHQFLNRNRKLDGISR